MVRKLYRRLMGFPDDLPNLARFRPPGGNTRAEGHRGVRLRETAGMGTLPESY